ncbi:MAG TPA: hypothetical protein DDW23_06310 [Planctomycetes bacterium]|nr:hypothetical protein [Planctomycetota bacterium]
MVRHPKSCFAIGALLLFFAAAMSAWRSHGLVELLPPENLLRFDSALQQHTMAGAGALVVGVLGSHVHSRWISLAAVCFVLGFALFCGDVYLRAFSSSLTLHTAPFGGVLLILGWAAVACGALLGGWSRHPDSNWG